jgi:Uma2 family endonuclease
MVVEGPLAYQAGRRDTLMNPTLIVEVLSKSTQDYDRGDKFAAYRTIPTLQEYVLVDQYSYQVEHYSKTGTKQWLFQAYDSPENRVELASVPFAIAVQDLYDKVEFDSAEPNPTQINPVEQAE